MLFVASVFLRDIQLKFYVDFFFEVITVRNWVEIDHVKCGAVSLTELIQAFHFLVKPLFNVFLTFLDPTFLRSRQAQQLVLGNFFQSLRGFFRRYQYVLPELLLSHFHFQLYRLCQDFWYVFFQQILQ